MFVLRIVKIQAGTWPGERVMCGQLRGSGAENSVVTGGGKQDLCLHPHQQKHGKECQDTSLWPADVRGETSTAPGRVSGLSETAAQRRTDTMAGLSRI